jgi:signal peptide peptidase SppA
LSYLPHVADRVLNRPLAIHPSKAEIILAVLEGRIGISAGQPPAPDASAFTGSRRKSGGGGSLYRQENGIAIIPVLGSLVNRGAWLDAYSGMTSYEGLAAQFKSAGADKDVKAVITDIDSPGGEATGMFGLAETIRQVRKSKPVVAVVNDLAASAAYGIASAADEIVISPTSIVGSIGVVMLHLDRSGEMTKKGVKPTFIHAGAHKVDGHPFGPLSKEIAADLQRDVLSFYDRFLETVAEGRGAKLIAKAARATEARTYIGADAIKIGLADRMGSFDDVLRALSQRTTRPSSARGNQGEKRMFQSDHESYAAGKEAGISEERSRISAILGLEEAKGREDQALALVGAGVDAEAAKAVLAATPRVPTLDARMAALPDGGNAPLGGPAGHEPPRSPSAAWDKHIERQNASIPAAGGNHPIAPEAAREAPKPAEGISAAWDRSIASAGLQRGGD